MNIHVDGDVVMFRAGFGAEHTEYDVMCGERSIPCRYKKDADAVAAQLERSMGIETTIEKRHVLEPLSHALSNVRSILSGVLETLEGISRDMTVWFSCPSEDNFRREVATIKPYKGNRDKAHRPTYEQEIKDYIVQKWYGRYTEGQEADDAMGIAQCSVPFGLSCIVTNDKDLDMIPGLHYNFVKDEKYVVSSDTAAWMFWQQMIKGDSTDNIQGIPGYGEQKAAKAVEDIWDDEDAMREVAWTLYVQSYGLCAYPAMLEMGRLLWIRRKENELWSPNLNRGT